MSKNMLCNVIETLELQHQLTSYQQKKCKQFFEVVKKGDYIYPGQLKSKMGTNIKIAYQILEALKQEGFVENAYEVYCFECGNTKRAFLDSLAQFNLDWHCDFCGHPLSLTENIIVLYKVIKV